MSGDKYEVEILSAAENQLKKLSTAGRKKVGALIDKISRNPRPHGHIQLKGPLKGYLRVRSGDFRVIYQVDDRSIIVTVIAVGDRKDIYR